MTMVLFRSDRHGEFNPCSLFLYQIHSVNASNIFKNCTIKAQIIPGYVKHIGVSIRPLKMA
jgi:hypothetical protein